MDGINNMSQVTTGELSFLSVLVQGGGLAALGFFMRHWFNTVNTKLDNFASSQHACQLMLPEKYVQKHECEKDMAVHSASILKIAGKLNGGSLHHDSGH